MAIWSFQSTVLSFDFTASKASELVRTKSPNRFDIFGSIPSALHFIKSLTDPITPPLNTAPLVLNVFWDLKIPVLFFVFIW